MSLDWAESLGTKFPSADTGYQEPKVLRILVGGKGIWVLFRDLPVFNSN